MKQNTNFTISNDLALGVFDSDGSVLLLADIKKSKNGHMSLGFYVKYCLEQTSSKKDLVEKFASKFEGKVTYPSSKAVFRANPNNSDGKQFRQFLNQNKPLLPGRRRDYLISEQVLNLKTCNMHKTKEGLITISRLVANRSISQAYNTVDSDFNKWLAIINASQAEVINGTAKADALLKVIEAEVDQLSTQLLSMKLSKDYILGAHFGDGSFTVATPWAPPEEEETTKRLRCEPIWTISGADESYCRAFANTCGGYNDLMKSNTSNYNYRVVGIQNCKLIVNSLFSNVPWMPEYKLEQLSWFKEAVQLLDKQEHLTKEGLVKLVDLIYNKSEKGKRPYTKQQYIDWGLKWLKEHKYI